MRALAIAATMALACTLACQNDTEPGPGDYTPVAGDTASGDSASGDPHAGDPHAGDPHAGDPHAGDPQPGDPHAGDPGGDDHAGDPGGGDPGVQDFVIRQPQSREVTCTVGTAGTFSFMDVDHFCELSYDGLEAEVYIQASAVDCQNFMFPAPIMDAVAAWTRIDGVVSPTSAYYTYGGQHHLDLLKVDIQGTLFVIDHSSYTVGARTCAPPDCLIECEAGATFDTCDRHGGFVVNGCVRTQGSGPPPHPVLCVVVEADGSIPPLLDPWVAHTGHDEYPLLPCIGDWIP